MRANVFAGSVITADSPFWKRPVDPVGPTPESIIPRSCCWHTSVIAGEVRFLSGSCRLRPINAQTSNSYYRAIGKSNASLVTERIAAITPTGIQTADGVRHDLDVIVLATGFQAHNYMRPMNLLGRNGLSIDDA
jgi:hypothetical protein